MKIQYWSDYACPFCYIGSKNLKEALKELNLEETPLEFRSFELDPNPEQPLITDLVGFFAEKYGIPRESAMERINDIHEMAKDAGLGFDYTKVQKSSTLNAHRLTKLAAEKGLENKATELLYAAYFDDHKNLNDPETLREIGNQLGLDPEEVNQLLENPEEYLSDVRADEIESYQLGVQGVPFFVINEELAIPGAISKDQWKQVLSQFA